MLVVDDNVDTVTTLAMLVKKDLGHDGVRTAYDGASAVEAALRLPTACRHSWISAWPGLNGFEIARRIREQPALRNTVLVAMTGYGQESDRQRSKEAGFDHHLVKPAEFGRVLEILAAASEVLP